MSLMSLGCSELRASAGAEESPVRSPVAPVTPLEAGQAEVVFAGGCFWCMEAPFDRIPGVVSTTSGYAGGAIVHPTYREVSSGRTRHLEVIRVVYDPERVTFNQLLEVFWHNVDPTDDGGQFCDRGHHYTSAIFARGAEERRAAQASLERAQNELRSRGQTEPIVTPIRESTTFYAAEGYHQDYYRTNPRRYTQYRTGCGRDRRLSELWGSSAH